MKKKKRKDNRGSRRARRHDSPRRVRLDFAQLRELRVGDHRRIDGNAFLERALEVVKLRTYDRKYPNLKARQFVPLDPEIDAAAETVRIASYSQVGVARLLQSYADDLPRSDVQVEEVSRDVKGIGASYGYSIQEIRAAAKAGTQLQSKKAAAARRSVEVQIDRILSLGDASTGLLGLLNQTNALTYTVPAGVSLSALWADKTPLEIVADMVGICEYIVVQTQEVEKPNLLLLPRTQYTQIATTRYDSNSDTTILQWFQRVYPGVAVDTWYRLAGAGSGSTDRMVAYTLSPEHLQGGVPQEFEQLPPQEDGLEFIVPCHARVAGVFLYYPLSMAYGDGI